jgi:hypothetical protein
VVVLIPGCACKRDLLNVWFKPIIQSGFKLKVYKYKEPRDLSVCKIIDGLPVPDEKYNMWLYYIINDDCEIYIESGIHDITLKKKIIGKHFCIIIYQKLNKSIFTNYVMRSLVASGGSPSISVCKNLYLSDFDSILKTIEEFRKEGFKVETRDSLKGPDKEKYDLPEYLDGTASKNGFEIKFYTGPGINTENNEIVHYLALDYKLSFFRKKSQRKILNSLINIVNQKGLKIQDIWENDYAEYDE